MNGKVKLRKAFWYIAKLFLQLGGVLEGDYQLCHSEYQGR